MDSKETLIARSYNVHEALENHEYPQPVWKQHMEKGRLRILAIMDVHSSVHCEYLDNPLYYRLNYIFSIRTFVLISIHTDPIEISSGIKSSYIINNFLVHIYFSLCNSSLIHLFSFLFQSF